jgi:hypothetical protein
MKKIFLTSAITFCFAIIFASNDNETGAVSPIAYQKIEGKIIDHATNEALAGVALKLQNSNEKVYTDLDGNFVIEGIMPDVSYNIDILYLSYQGITLENLSTKDNALKLKVELESIQH